MLLLLALACSGPNVADDTAAPLDDTATSTDDTSPVDADDDGFPADTDCDDTDAAVNPAATEACDGADNDCDQLIDEAGATGEVTGYADDDGDGFGDPEAGLTDCELPTWYVFDSTDCDDTSDSVYPGAADDTADLVDNDCDGAVDEDFVAPDPCALDGSTASWWTNEYELTVGDIGYPLAISGNTTICEITCDDVWLEPMGVEVGEWGAACSKASFRELPTEAVDYTYVCIYAYDLGVENAGTTAACRARTSAGELVISLTWAPPR